MAVQQEVVSVEKMCEAYLEYRTAQFKLMFEEALDLGLISFLGTPRTVKQIAQHFQFVRGLKGLNGILNSFVKFGVVTKTTDENCEEYFKLLPEYRLPEINIELLQIAVGKRGVEDLKQINAFSQIFAYMFGQREEVRFDRQNEQLWEEFLEYPYYAFGRQRAVEYISFPSAAVLDFGAGLGHGTESIAAIVGRNGRAVAVESSLDFVEAAIKRLTSTPQVEVKHLDMGSDLVAAFGEKTFDGAMFVGAFHYVKDKFRCLKELSSVLRPGGKLVIGNWFTKNGALDEGMLEFGTAMIDPPAYGISPEEFYSYLADVGFDIEQQYFFGCQGWFFMQLKSS